MKQNYLKSLFLMLMMCVGMSAWGDEVTATLTFTAACGGSGTDDNHNSWTITSDAAESTYDGTKGIHYGTGKAAVSHLKLSNSTITGIITKIVVNASGASGTSAKIDVKVGGSAFDSQKSLTSSNAAYTFSGSASGNIEISLTQTSATKALYVKSVAVTFSTAADTRTAVNMTGFSATPTTLIKGETTTTTVTNDQSDWTAAYTYESSNTSVATVSNDGIIAAVAKGTATITATLNIANDDATWKKGATSSKTIDITVNNPSHTAKFSVNGTIDESKNQNVEEGETITFPANPSVDDVVFIGWTKTAIDKTSDNAPSDIYTSATMGTEDVTYYALFATESTSSEPTAYTAGATGDFVLATFNNNKWYALPNNPTVSSGKIAGVEITISTSSSSVNYVTTSNASGYTWTIANATNGQTISDGTNYIYHSNGGASGTNLAYGKSTSYTWKIESETNGLTFKGMSGSTVNSRGMLASGTSFGGYALSNEDATGYYRIQVLPIGGSATYSDFCTTVSAKATATLEIADADKNVALGYNETKDVNIAVNATEYDGTLTVASTDDKVVTVTYTGTTATINYVGEGEAYISVTAPSTANYYAINTPQAIKVTTTDDRQVAEVTIDPATISVDNGASAEVTVTTAYDGTITAVSDKPTVATVTYADGKVTVEGKSVGTATLTISGEGNATYKPFSKTFAITVNKVVPFGIKNLRSQITATSSSSANNYEVTLVDAVVTYVSNGTTPTIYLEDAEAGIAIYAKNTNLAVGDKLNGVVTGKGYVYNGLTELTTITGFEKTTGATVPCHEITLAQLAEDGMDAWESRRVVVKDLTITSAMDNRNATVEQNGVSFTLREGVSGCSDEKLSSTDNGIVSAIGYFQDYNSTTQFNIWSADDIVLAEKANAQNVLELDENATEIAEIYDEYDKVVVKRTIKANTWSTLCLPFAMDPEQVAANFGEDAEVKILTGLTVNGTSYTMNFDDCDEIGAALPCMIRVSKPISEIVVEGKVEVDTTEKPEDSEENGDDLITFVGSYTKSSVAPNDGNYIISSNKFYYVDSTVTNKGFRGYFNLFTLDSAVKSLSMSFDNDADAIQMVENKKYDTKIFNLQGQRVDKAQKGIYIINGRKVVK